MRKKLVLQRNLRKGGAGGAPHLRYLVIAAACLTVLVILTHYLFKEKNEQVTRRPVPEQGMITKELPRLAEQKTPVKLPEPSKPGETAGAPETIPPDAGPPSETIKTSGTQPAPKAPEPAPVVPQKPSPEEEASSQGIATTPEKVPAAQSAKPGEPAPKDLFPKKKAASETAQKGPIKPQAKAGGNHLPAKPAGSAKAGDYAIQVGSVYADRSQAQAVIKDLSAKGYKAMVRTCPNGRGYLVLSSQLTQSKAYTLQEQMKIQGVNDVKVIKAVPESGGPAGGTVPQGRAATPGEDNWRN
jgi:hypothetical protein